MATHGEFDGVSSTIQALRMYHGSAAEDVSFLVIDNDPGAPTAAALRAIGDWVPRYRYVPFNGWSGTAVRDLVFREADADVVCCVDSHVLLAPGALKALRDWFDAHPDSRDLLQGPLLHDDLDLDRAVTHLEPTWGAGMFGQWAHDERLDDPAGEPFEIAMQGLGVFACLRSAWPGLNPRLRGFGGEEGYLHETFRRRGGRVLCHPRLRWAHRFARPTGISYPNRWEDRIRNYLVAWGEIGWDVAPMEAHFLELLGTQFDVQAVIDAAHELVEHPLGAFDAVLCVAGGDCDAHAHPAPLAWRVEHVEPTRRSRASSDAWRRGDARWRPRRRGAIATRSCSTAAGRVPTPCRSRPLGMGAPVGSLPAAGELGRGAGGGKHHHGGGWPWPTSRSRALRAIRSIVADLGADEAARAAFLATWPDLKTYLLDGTTAGTFAAIGEPFASPPSTVRPRTGPAARRGRGRADGRAEQGLLARAQQHGFDGARAVRRQAGPWPTSPASWPRASRSWPRTRSPRCGARA